MESGFLPLAAPTALNASGLPTAAAKIKVAPGLTERYCSQGLPNFLLEFGPVRLEGKIKLGSLVREILSQLSLRLEQDRMAYIEIQCIEFHSVRTFLLPENGNESVRARHQFEFTDR
jgi:hypothetical protein